MASLRSNPSTRHKWYHSYIYAPPESVGDAASTDGSTSRWDNVFFFRRGRSTSIATTSESDVDEHSHLLSGVLHPIDGSDGEGIKNRMARWCNHMWKRNLIFIVLPVMIVVVWVSIPLRYSVPSKGEKPELDFFWFLFAYYGFYNFVSLMFITRLFELYSLDWYPAQIGGVISFTTLWLGSLGLGWVARYVVPEWQEYTLFWVLLTFFMMTWTLFSAFWKIRAENRNVNRRSLTLAQRTFPSEEMMAELTTIPASYRRFLWFCLVLSIALATLCLGGAYSYWFLTTLPHTGLEGLVYVYSWVIVVYALDFLVEYIVDTRIKSHPLSSCLRLYFYLLYFIYYRNLFARLRNVEQFALIQLASSIWVMLFYPVRMTRMVYNGLVNVFGIESTYEQYCKSIGASFFTRNVAENASMLGFLIWVNILHFGPNSRLYPYFSFDTPGDPYNYRLTMLCSLGVWFSELASSFVARHVLKRKFDHSITREAVRDFLKYPRMVECMVWVVMSVLMDILLALLAVHFSPPSTRMHV